MVEQKNDFENIKYLLENHNYVIILGSGGTGKTYNILKLKEYYESIGKKISITTPTGISAINVEGVTINSLLKFSDTNSIKEYDIYLNSIYSRSSQKIEELKKSMRKEISNIDLLVIDEISMISGEKWELINFLLNMYDFKGKILLSGDIFQLKPVFKKSKYTNNEDEDEEVLDDRLFFESPNWKSYRFVPYILNTIYRTNNIQYINVLHNIRLGMYNNEDAKYLYELTKNKNVLNNNPTILASKNSFVFKYNKQKLDEIKQDVCVKEYKVRYSKIDYSNSYKNEVKNYINGFLNIEKTIYLKIDALVIFLINENNYVNGEKGVVLDILEDVIKIEKENGDVIDLERKNFIYYDYTENGFEKIATIKQFPIKLGYAMTIHKSQSLTMNNIIIYFENMFASGQFYVALSRAKNPNNVLIKFNKYGFNMFEYELKKSINVEKKILDFYNKALSISKNYLN